MVDEYNEASVCPTSYYLGVAIKGRGLLRFALGCHWFSVVEGKSICLRALPDCELRAINEPFVKQEDKETRSRYSQSIIV